MSYCLGVQIEEETRYRYWLLFLNTSVMCNVLQTRHVKQQVTTAIAKARNGCVGLLAWINAVTSN